jgi:hypothetical protein
VAAVQGTQSHPVAVMFKPFNYISKDRTWARVSKLRPRDGSVSIERFIQPARMLRKFASNINYSLHQACLLREAAPSAATFWRIVASVVPAGELQCKNIMCFRKIYS